MEMLLWLAAATPMTMALLWEASHEPRRVVPAWLHALLLAWLCLGAVLFQ
jgi:hypothetical protein